MRKLAGIRLRAEIPNIRGRSLSQSTLEEARELRVFISGRSTECVGMVDVLGKAILVALDGTQIPVHLIYVPGCTDEVKSYIGVIPHA